MAIMEFLSPASVASSSVKGLRFADGGAILYASMLEFSASPRSETYRFVRSLDMSSYWRTTVRVKLRCGLKSGTFRTGLTVILVLEMSTDTLKRVGVKSIAHCVLLRKL